MAPREASFLRAVGRVDFKVVTITCSGSAIPSCRSLST